MQKNKIFSHLVYYAFSLFWMLVMKDEFFARYP